VLDDMIAVMRPTGKGYCGEREKRGRVWVSVWRANFVDRSGSLTPLLFEEQQPPPFFLNPKSHRKHICLATRLLSASVPNLPTLSPDNGNDRSTVLL
jgi:hypothetical protein